MATLAEQCLSSGRRKYTGTIFSDRSRTDTTVLNSRQHGKTTNEKLCVHRIMLWLEMCMAVLPISIFIGENGMISLAMDSIALPQIIHGPYFLTISLFFSFLCHSVISTDDIIAGTDHLARRMIRKEEFKMYQMQNTGPERTDIQPATKDNRLRDLTRL